MDLVPVMTTEAGQPKGPYSQGIIYGDLLFVSGSGPFDPRTGESPGEDIATQARATLSNLRAIVEASGFSLRKTLKVTVFLADFGDFAAFNEVYREFFSQPFPARSAIEAGRLAFGTKCSVDAIVGR